MSKVYFGEAISTIRTNDEIARKIEEAYSNILEAINLYSREYKSFGSYYDGDDNYGFSSTKQTRVERIVKKTKEQFNLVFPKSTYLDDLTIDYSRGDIRESDFKRYYSNLFDFMNVFKIVDTDAERLNIIQGLNFSRIDIPEVYKKKKEYLLELLRVDEQHLEYMIENDPIFKYSKLEFDIDKEMLLYELMIDKKYTDKASISSFYNTFLVNSFNYGVINKEYEFVKLSDKELELSEYFGGKLKRYMYKPTYDSIIIKYNKLFKCKYGLDLFSQIENEPIITKYRMVDLC